MSCSFHLLFCCYCFFGFSSNNGGCYNWKTMKSGVVWIRSVWIAIVVWMVASIVCCRNNWSNNLWYNYLWSYVLNYWESYWGKWSSSSGSIKVLLEFYLCSSNISSICYVRFSSGNVGGIGKVWLSCGYSFSIGKVQSSAM